MGDCIHLQDWWLSLLQNRSSVPGSPSAPQAPVTASRDGGCAVIPDYLSQASSTRLPWGERLKTHVHPLQPIRDRSQSNEETLKRITSVRCITLYMMRLCSRGNCRLCILLVFWHTRCTSQNYTKACFLRRKEVLRNQKTIYFLFLKLIKIEGAKIKGNDWKVNIQELNIFLRSNHPDRKSWNVSFESTLNGKWINIKHLSWILWATILVWGAILF